MTDENFKDKVVKKVLGGKPKDALMRLMSNNEFDVLEYDENGNVQFNEEGKPIISERKSRIRSMYDLQTNPRFKSSKDRRMYYKINKKKLIKQLEKEDRDQEYIDKEVSDLQCLYSKGYYPEFEGQDIKKLYDEEVRTNGRRTNK